MNFYSRNREWIILFAILIIAVFFRFYQLDTIPPGLWPDEAANGVDALNALDSAPPAGGFKIFYPNNNGREGLFINLQAVSIHFFGAKPWALRLVSAIMGSLTVLGLYFLTKYIFNWRLAAVASFFMAISFWHVVFSRIGFRAIMLPLVLVWGFYFLWRGLRTGKLREFLVAGLIGGIGFYTYFSFRIAPLIILILFANYWSYLKKDFHHEKYEETRNKLLRGFALLMLTVIILASPLMIYFYTHPEDILKREGRPISVFEQQEPFKELALSTVRTLGMFNFSGDWNLRHNIPGSSQLALPIGIFFAIGFIRELIHWLKRKHGHFSVSHTFLFSWFFVMLLPGILSTEAPHALRTIGTIPVIMIFAAQGFWWCINAISRWHHLTDFHAQTDSRTYKKESRVLIALTITVFLTALVSLEYYRYFKVWGDNPSLKDSFSQKLVDIAGYLNNDETGLPKYILVNEGDVLVDGVPNNAQTIKFLSVTHSLNCSDEKNIYYLGSDQLSDYPFPKEFTLIPLTDNPELRNDLFWNLGLYPEEKNSFTLYKN